LVHDDLPCFDDAPTRRGRASVHWAFGQPLAVLAGDALIVMAFQTLAAAAGAQAAVSVVDDAGQRVTLARPAQRVISMAPHITELLFAAGGGARIVGAMNYSDYPAAARSIPLIGSNSQIDIERVIAMKPDLLIVWQSGNTARQIAELQGLGIPVFHSEPRNFMLLPRDVHAAFDDGRVMFVPSLSSIKCFVLSPAGVSDAVRQLHGRDLHLPLLTSPYKRMLAFFARCATRQSFTSLDGDVQAALESAMASSEDSAGNEALQSLIDRMVDVGLVSGGRGE
jgi:hypothetical protein